MASRVERLRDLRFVRPPRVRVMSAAELAAFGRRLAEASSRRGSGYPARLPRPRRLERAWIGFEQLAGIVPEQPGSDATAPGSIEDIDAAYDYLHKRILLVQGAIETRRELQLVLAHELTHALEDQHLPLRLGLRSA
jgi:Zn-dependent protease with chaperone function